jgi:hypothetical protein
VNVDATDLIGRLNSMIDAQHTALNALEESRLADLGAQAELIKSAKGVRSVDSVQKEAIAQALQNQKMTETAFSSAVTERRDLLASATGDVTELAALFATLAAPIASADPTSSSS